LETPKQYAPLFSSSYPLPGDAPERDPLDELVSHRSAVLKSQVEGLCIQLYERAQIREQNLKRIEYDTVKIDTELLQLDALVHSCWQSSPPEFLKRRDNLEREIMNLERQRRDEDTSFWKDRVLLRKELPEIAGAYEAAKAREGLLDGVKDDGI